MNDFRFWDRKSLDCDAARILEAWRKERNIYLRKDKKTTDDGDENLECAIWSVGNCFDYRSTGNDHNCCHRCFKRVNNH